jgi:nicotinamidase-related amidase
MSAALHQLPIPAHFDPSRVSQIWRVPYQQRADEARRWAQQHALQPAAADDIKIALILIDVQNTFCLPDFELFVGGRSGTGAVDDNRRLCEFLYRHLANITRIYATLDTHQAAQIFHPLLLTDADGNPPPPMTLISAEDVRQGKWRFNPQMAASLGVSAEYGQRHLEHYTAELARRGKYDLTIWPYHAMLGGIGHALVPAVEEAIFFHTVARATQPDFEIKGEHPLTEHYSAVGPEVNTGPDGQPLALRSSKYLQVVQHYDAVVVAGQAKSHCVAWTVADLLADIQSVDASLARKVYLLADCTSPVVVPGVVDYTDDADAAYARFAAAGMHLTTSTDFALNGNGTGIK